MYITGLSGSADGHGAIWIKFWWCKSICCSRLVMQWIDYDKIDQKILFWAPQLHVGPCFLSKLKKHMWHFWIKMGVPLLLLGVSYHNSSKKCPTFISTKICAIKFWSKWPPWKIASLNYVIYNAISRWTLRNNDEGY